ncbi:MAG: TniB family NTP-binding protein [Yoonia sp.]|nr:TniB family NTP-binding protein [Yoonia sp.]
MELQMHNERTVYDIMTALRSLRITTSREKELLCHLTRLLRQGPDGEPLAEAVTFTATGETRGILVVDAPGGGKSTLVSHVLSKHAVLGAEPTGTPRYIEALVPSPGTHKNMGAEILEKTQYPEISGRRDAFDYWKLARRRMTILGYVVLWIDEAHDLFEKDKNLILRALKSLMQGDDAVIVILSGTEALARIVRTDPQVQRRFSILELQPISVENDLEMFSDVIANYTERAGLEWSGETEAVERLFHASRNVFGRCVETILNAIEVALNAGSSQLTLDHFAMTWAHQEGCSADANVFLADAWWAIQPDTEEPVTKTSRRKRR